MAEPGTAAGTGPSPEWVHEALESLREAAWRGGGPPPGCRGLGEELRRLGVPLEALRAYLAFLDDRAAAGVPSGAWSR